MSADFLTALVEDGEREQARYEIRSKPMNEHAVADFTKMVFEGPQEYLESIWAWSEEAAVMVASAFDEDEKSSPAMLRAAWFIAKRHGINLSCHHCGVAMLAYKQHESCRRKASADFDKWLEEDQSPSDDEFSDLVEEMIVNEGRSRYRPSCAECSSKELQLEDQLHGTCKECGYTW